MALSWLTQLALWVSAAASSQQRETWHLVDLAQVVCPKPTNLDAAAPQLGEYNVGIEYTGMRTATPHIVSFMRTSQQAVSISFKIEDANGQTVVPQTTVNLDALSDTVPSSCTCTNPSIPTSVSATYGLAYGTSCAKWDEQHCGDLWGNLTVGGWCCRPWCYATADCPDAYSSQAIPGQFFSYAACNSVTTTAAPGSTSTCKWTEVQTQNDPCACRNVGDLFSPEMLAKFPLNYGATCGTWDFTDCATNYRPDQLDTWCCASWCYVDKACPSAKDSLNAGMQGVLYWSDNECVDDAALMLQCPFYPQSSNETTSNCTCLTEEIPASVLNFTALGLNASTYQGYGTYCAPHDHQDCHVLYPGADWAMWCCMSWCYVPETCATARGSTVWPGHYWSEDHCQMEAEVVSSCQYDSSCQCRGALPSGTLNAPFPATYGSECKPWDSVSCKDVWSNQENATWNSSGDNEWCCDSWCYVNISCPIAKLSWFLPGYYWSYETCDDPEWSYVESTDTCDGAHRRRYQFRRLSGRRRSGGSWSSGGSRRRSSWSSPPSRRRAPYVPATSPRRRSWSKPSASTPRRRAPTWSPRRRAPSPPARRRAPPPPAPAPVATRRRTSSINGQSYSTTRRRAVSSGGVADTTRRRRTTAYGYSDRPSLASNHGGYMPHQTSYGYSSYNSYPPQSSTNVAMYAAGGFAAGAGSMYIYNSMYNSDLGFHRRRYMNSMGYNRADWCIVTAGGSRNGAFMECHRCYNIYGYAYCPSSSDCLTAKGCSYTTPTSFSRDDLAATGFVPSEYTPPLKVTFTSITGQGIDTDPVSGICPPQTAAQADLIESFNKTLSFKPDLFLVLTEQETLRTAASCETDTTTTCSSSCWIDHSVCVNGRCECQNGFCWNGRTCSATGIGSAQSQYMVWPLLALLLVALR